MNTTTMTKVLGGGFLAIGILGFIPAMTPDGRLFGIFPVNAMHNVVHLAFGVWGLLAANSATASTLYGRAVAIGYVLLALLGLIPATSTLFGLVPLDGPDVVLHLVLALVGAYIGWSHRVAYQPPREQRHPI